MNIFERSIGALAPQYALKRARARAALSHVRSYEGDARGRRTDSWRTAGTSANTETRASLHSLRARARDLVRNNNYAARAVSILESNIIGYGIKTTIKTANKKTLKPLMSKWSQWAESTDCDADGMHDMYGLQALAMRSCAESGEVLIRRLWRKDQPLLAVPFQLRVIESDYIDTGKDGMKVGKNTVVQGVEFDPQGRRAAYWLFSSHPGDNVSVDGLRGSVRVPAEDVIHLFRVDRPGQVRGVTWFAPAIIRMRDFDEYADAQLVRQKIAACFTAFVHDTDGSEVTGMPGASRLSSMTEMLEPGVIEHMPPGKTITFATPPVVTGFREYTMVTQGEIAAGIGVPYESLTGDYSQFNFSSGRMSRTEFNQLVDLWQWKMFVPRFCGGVFGWFRQGAQIMGLPGAADCIAAYTPPAKVLVDSTREVPAIIKAIRGGLKTLNKAILETGEDPDDTLAEIRDINKKLDDFEITLDSDPRNVSQQGQAQVAPVAGGEVTNDAKTTKESS